MIKNYKNGTLIKKGGNMKTVKHEIKLERSVKIILAVFAVGVLLNAFTIGDIISSAEAYHHGPQQNHIWIANWPNCN